VYNINTRIQVRHSAKLKPIYVGPLLVTKVLSPVLYRVENVKKMSVLHHDRLRPYGSDDVPAWARRKRKNLLDGAPADESTFVVDELDGNVSLILEKTIEDAEVPLVPSEAVGDTVCQDPVQWMEEGELGIEALFQLPLATRMGRRVHKPSYLKDYVP